MKPALLRGLQLPATGPLLRTLGSPLRVPLRLRVFFRGAFALLALAVLALALSVLRDEKQRSHRAYAEGLRQNQAQIAARLRHPAGQLALLNPAAADRPAQPLHPLLLPFAALDFDDRQKALQAVEMSGCALQYPDGSTLCAAVGANPYAGGFVYLVASLAAGPLQAHTPGTLDPRSAHRVQVQLDYRGQTQRWLAPYQVTPDGRGRLTGFADEGPLTPASRPVRDFRGWLWQDGRCQSTEPAGAMPDATCTRTTWLSIRLPVAVFSDALAARNPVWPPPDLDQLTLRLQLLPPGEGAPLFDSAAPGAVLPFSLAELRALLRPGEQLLVQREGQARPLLQLSGVAPAGEAADAAAEAARAGGLTAPWVARLVRQLPVDGFDAPLVAQERLVTPLGRFALTLRGDLRSVNQGLAQVATRLLRWVGLLLAAVLLTWLAIELRIIRRVTLLTKRAAAVSLGIRADGGAGDLAALDLSDLRGRDELGVLAQGLKDLLQRVHEDVRRGQIRAQQEQDMWHAVGHEIMSPLQSLLVLHGQPGDPSARYIQRMQQAVRVLYGQASPSEAFANTTLASQPLDLDAFLQAVAANAAYIDIADVHYTPHGQPLMVRADEHALEDVVTHVLRNAARHRTAGTPITLALDLPADAPAQAEVRIHNQGPPIAPALLARVFDYGVSGPAAGAADPAEVETTASAPGQRGQGLFVARTYMAKMGGTIEAANTVDGVVLRLQLPRLPPA